MSDRERFALLHTLLVRLRDQPKLMEDQADPLVRKLEGFAKAVRRDIHKMRAFVRFREMQDDGGTRLRRVVRARIPHRPRQRGVLRQSLRGDALVDPDARHLRSIGTASG